MGNTAADRPEESRDLSDTGRSYRQDHRVGARQRCLDVVHFVVPVAAAANRPRNSLPALKSDSHAFRPRRLLNRHRPRWTVKDSTRQATCICWRNESRLTRTGYPSRSGEHVGSRSTIGWTSRRSFGSAKLLRPPLQRRSLAASHSWTTNGTLTVRSRLKRRSWVCLGWRLVSQWTNGSSCCRPSCQPCSSYMRHTVGTHCCLSSAASVFEPKTKSIGNGMGSRPSAAISRRYLPQDRLPRNGRRQPGRRCANEDRITGASERFRSAARSCPRAFESRAEPANRRADAAVP